MTILKSESEEIMEKIIRDMVEKAIYYKENLKLYDEARELLQFAREIIDEMATTINCPSNWRDIGEELAEEYKDNDWVFDGLELWNHDS